MQTERGYGMVTALRNAVAGSQKRPRGKPHMNYLQLPPMGVFRLCATLDPKVSPNVCLLAALAR